MSTVLYILLGIFMVFMAIRFALTMSMKRKKGQPAPDLSGKAGKVIRQGKKALFYFYGPTCPPCVQMSPIVDKMADKYQNIFKIDVSKDMSISRQFGVLGTPSLVLVENGKIVDFIMGPQGEKALERILNK